MRYVTKKFDSVGKYLHYLNTTPTNDVFKNQNLASQATNKPYWSGTNTYSDADDLLRYGDKELFAKVRAQLAKNKVTGTGESSKRQYYSDVCGFVPHVSNFVQGLPNNMINKRVVRYKNSKVVTIIYNTGVDCSIDVDNVIKVSIQVMNFVAGLESKGYRVNLYTMNIARTKNELASSIVRIKQSEDYTDRLKLVYPMVHPSMTRRQMLRFVEVCDIKDVNFISDYGSPIAKADEVKRILNEQGVKYDYYFDYYEVSKNGINI